MLYINSARLYFITNSYNLLEVKLKPVYIYILQPIFVILIFRHIFNEADEAVLNYQLDDNQRIEPEWYIPILPMVLVNGAEGIGTGWSTKIPNYNPR